MGVRWRLIVVVWGNGGGVGMTVASRDIFNATPQEQQRFLAFLKRVFLPRMKTKRLVSSL